LWSNPKILGRTCDGWTCYGLATDGPALDGPATDRRWIDLLRTCHGRTGAGRTCYGPALDGPATDGLATDHVVSVIIEWRKEYEIRMIRFPGKPTACWGGNPVYVSK
jgi:hypothetical protein